MSIKWNAISIPPISRIYSYHNIQRERLQEKYLLWKKKATCQASRLSAWWGGATRERNTETCISIQSGKWVWHPGWGQFSKPVFWGLLALNPRKAKLNPWIFTPFCPISVGWTPCAVMFVEMSSPGFRVNVFCEKNGYPCSAPCYLSIRCGCSSRAIFGSSLQLFLNVIEKAG